MKRLLAFLVFLLLAEPVSRFLAGSCLQIGARFSEYRLSYRESRWSRQGLTLEGVLVTHPDLTVVAEEMTVGLSDWTADLEWIRPEVTVHAIPKESSSKILLRVHDGRLRYQNGTSEIHFDYQKRSLDSFGTLDLSLGSSRARVLRVGEEIHASMEAVDLETLASFFPGLPALSGEIWGEVSGRLDGSLEGAATCYGVIGRQGRFLLELDEARLDFSKGPDAWERIRLSFSGGRVESLLPILEDVSGSLLFQQGVGASWEVKANGGLSCTGRGWFDPRFEPWIESTLLLSGEQLGELKGRGGELTFSWNRVPSSLFAPWLGLPFEKGTWSGRAKAPWTSELAEKLVLEEIEGRDFRVLELEVNELKGVGSHFTCRGSDWEGEFALFEESGRAVFKSPTLHLFAEGPYKEGIWRAPYALNQITGLIELQWGHSVTISARGSLSGIFDLGGELAIERAHYPSFEVEGIWKDGKLGPLSDLSVQFVNRAIRAEGLLLLPHLPALRLSGEADGPSFDLRFSQKLVEKARLKGRYEGGEIKLADLSYPVQGRLNWMEKTADLLFDLPLVGVGELHLEPTEFSLNSQEISCHAKRDGSRLFEGRVEFLDKVFFDFEGTPFDWTLREVALNDLAGWSGKGAGPFELQIDLKKNVSIKGFSLDGNDPEQNPFSLRATRVDWDAETLSVYGLKGALRQADFFGDLQYRSGQIRASLKGATVPFLGEKRSLQGILIQGDLSDWHLDSQLLYSDGIATLEIEKHPDRGLIRLTDTGPPLELRFGEKLESIEGTFGGIEAHFFQDQEGLLGTAHIDFHRLSQWLPDEAAEVFSDLEMGRGFELKGRLDPHALTFRGLLSGKQIELFGYEFGSLIGRADLSLEEMRIYDVHISDNGVSATADEILLTNHLCQIEIPHIRLTELRPSLLKKQGRSTSTIDPLVVRELRIDNLKGRLSDKKTLSATGSLSFLNTFRRGHSLLDLPADLFGRIIGLDLELLIPVQGHLTFSLGSGRVHLLELDESYSEGRRSKFALVHSGDSPSMDLDGTLHILVDMQQYVLFKITEAFLIQIDGTLDRPHYSLTKKRSFLGF